MNTLNTSWGLLLDFFRIFDMNCIYETLKLVNDMEIFYVIVGGGNCVGRFHLKN